MPFVVSWCVGDGFMWAHSGFSHYCMRRHCTYCRTCVHVFARLWVARNHGGKALSPGCVAVRELGRVLVSSRREGVARTVREQSSRCKAVMWALLAAAGCLPMWVATCPCCAARARHDEANLG